MEVDSFIPRNFIAFWLKAHFQVCTCLVFLEVLQNSDLILESSRSGFSSDLQPWTCCCLRKLGKALKCSIYGWAWPWCYFLFITLAFSNRFSESLEIQLGKCNVFPVDIQETLVYLFLLMLIIVEVFFIVCFLKLLFFCFVFKTRTAVGGHRNKWIQL